MRSFPLLILAVFVAASVLSGCDSTGSSANKPTASPAALQRSDFLVKMAHATESGGDLGGAERLYKQAVTAGGDSPAPYVELAEFYKRNHQQAQSTVVLNDALKLQPQNEQILRALANDYLNMGAPDKALPLLASPVAAASKDPLLYNTKGVAYDMLGEYAQAQKSYDTALKLDPDDAMTFKANLSMSYILSGSYNDAIELLRPLLDSSDVTPVIRQNLALAYGLSGQNDKALKLGLKDLSTKQAENNLKFYRMLAASHRKAKEREAADVTSAQPAKEKPEAAVAAEEPEKDVNAEKTETAVPVTPVTIDEPKQLAAKPVETPVQSLAPAAAPVAKNPPVTATFILPEPVLKPDRL